MDRVIVREFGGVDCLDLVEEPMPSPGAGEVVVRLVSIGMNHAELMMRRGEYKIASGDPPFTPGLEGGGIVEAVGESVESAWIGERVTLPIDAPRRPRVEGRINGTYRSHYVIESDRLVRVPDGVPDEMLGAMWLPYLTAYGALIWQQKIEPGQYVMLPACSSSVAIAASQIVRDAGGITIGTTTSPEKVEQLLTMSECHYDHIITTDHADWWKAVKLITEGHGVDVCFDPVAAGRFLNTEIRLLADYGTIWVYGLLGKVGEVDVTPLIRKKARIAGYVNNMLEDAPPETLSSAYQYILDRVADGRFRLPIVEAFALSEVRAAHERMERGGHIGKFILQP